MVPAYNDKFEFSKKETGLDRPVEVPLSVDEEKDYRRMLALGYGAVVKQARQEYDTLSPEKRDGYMAKNMAEVKRIVRQVMKTKLFNSVTESNKEKGFSILDK